jgi:cbb3-type cytochrome oxidase subunit 3
MPFQFPNFFSPAMAATTLQNTPFCSLTLGLSSLFYRILIFRPRKKGRNAIPRMPFQFPNSFSPAIAATTLQNAPFCSLTLGPCSLFCGIFILRPRKKGRNAIPRMPFQFPNSFSPAIAATTLQNAPFHSLTLGLSSLFYRILIFRPRKKGRNAIPWMPFQFPNFFLPAIAATTLQDTPFCSLILILSRLFYRN